MYQYFVLQLHTHIIEIGTIDYALVCKTATERVYFYKEFLLPSAYPQSPKASYALVKAPYALVKVPGSQKFECLLVSIYRNSNVTLAYLKVSNQNFLHDMTSRSMTSRCVNWSDDCSLVSNVDWIREMNF